MCSYFWVFYLCKKTDPRFLYFFLPLETALSRGEITGSIKSTLHRIKPQLEPAPGARTPVPAAVLQEGPASCSSRISASPLFGYRRQEATGDCPERTAPGVATGYRADISRTAGRGRGFKRTTCTLTSINVSPRAWSCGCALPISPMS